MNSITISGHLGKDSELRHIPSGEPVLSFSVADSQGRDKPTTWWACALWGKRAESLQQFLTKGQPVTVVGTVTERDYMDKEGQKRKSLDVRVNDLALQGGRKDAGDGAPAAPTARPAQKPVSRPAQPITTLDADDDMDIPF